MTPATPTGGDAAPSAIIPTYARAKLTFERGEGAWLIEADGRRFLDFAGGIAVSSLGHSHPRLVEALVEQARKVWHLSNIYQAPEGERFARRLCDLTFADGVFFTNSGAEANEGAIKMARRYHSQRGQPERYRIVTFEGAFHGRTLATIAAGGQKKYLDGFGPPVDGFDQVPFGDHEALLAAITPATGAILIEPIQGEGGIRPVPPQCLRGLRALCDERGLLLIYDEVQCGVGRTGKLFAHEWSGATPDIMTIAKGIGGGFPMAAILATAEAATGLTVGVHGTTFGGGPLAMAVGNALLDVVAEPAFLDHVARTGLALKQRLAELVDRHPRVLKGVRGEGLMLGLECAVPNGDLVEAARAEGMLTVAAGGNVVRLLPPLTVAEPEVAEAFARLDRACARVEEGLAAPSGARAAA